MKKLPGGVTIYANRGKKYVGEIPDELAVMTGRTEPVAVKITNKPDKAKSNGVQSS